VRGRLTESGAQDTLSPWRILCVTQADMLSTMRTLRAALIMLETCDVPLLTGLAYLLLSMMSRPPVPARSGRSCLRTLPNTGGKGRLRPIVPLR